MFMGAGSVAKRAKMKATFLRTAASSGLLLQRVCQKLVPDIRADSNRDGVVDISGYPDTGNKAL